MPALSDQQQRFLGIALGIAPAGPDPAMAELDAALASGDLSRVWNSGKELADLSIGALQSKLKGLGHPALDRIAEFGLNGITEGNQVALAKALIEFKSSEGEGRKTAAKALARQAAEYQAFIEGHKIIALCERNPFGVPVNIRAPISRALSKIRDEAAAAA